MWLFSRPHADQHRKSRPQTVTVNNGQWPPSSRTGVRETGRNYVPQSGKGSGLGVRAQVQISRLGSCVTLGELLKLSVPHCLICVTEIRMVPSSKGCFEVN